MAKRVNLSIARLRELREALDAAAGRDHLSDEDFVSYAGGEGTEADRPRISQHIEECEDCRAEIEWLTSVAEEWTGPRGEDRLRTFLNAVQQTMHHSIYGEKAGAGTQIRSWLEEFLEKNLRRSAIRLALKAEVARFSSSLSHFEATSPDDVFNILIDEDAGRDLTLRISSSALELEGVDIQLSTDGGESWTTRLRKVADNEVSGKITIGREQRTRMPVEAILRDALVSVNEDAS